MLVYDNHKRDRRERRLPISQPTAEVITIQQRRVRDRFPDTPLAELVLLPTPHANPAGRKPISSGLLDLRHRTWVDQLPVLRLHDGTEFDKTRIVPYAYRHTYAQRHADAGVAVDVLSQLLDHRTLEVTRRYYRVGEQRRRAAVDTVTALSFDRHGNRLWRDAHALLDSEHARYAVGDVAVPYGRCTEPSNVASRRRGLPRPVPLRRLRPLPHRRLIPARPDRLPRRPAAHPRTARRRPRRDRRLGPRRRHPHHRGDHPDPAADQPHQRRLAGLDPAERARIDNAVAVLRRHRAAHPVPLGMPTIRAAAPAPPTTPEATA